MKQADENLWRGLTSEARRALESKDYTAPALGQRLIEPGVLAGELVPLAASPERVKDVWIAGLEIFPRKVFRQLHRGTFAECARQSEGPLQRIGLWPKQWSTSRIFTGCAKGMHIHPPHVPEGKEPGAWFQSLYQTHPPKFDQRPYDKEQWDVWFFLQGTVEVLLIDLREGMPRRVMRFYADGEDKPGPNNVGVVIPAGVAHGLRVEGSQDSILLYGTSTVFRPEFEGRIVSDVEHKALPDSWIKLLEGR